jgi:hypothetical protein
LTSAGAGAEGSASPVFDPASPSSTAASEHRVGDASERCAAGAASERRSVAISDCGSSAASVTVTQHVPATPTTSRLRAKHGFCPRTIEVNPNHKSLRAIGDVLFNALPWIISLCTRCCTLGYVLLNGFSVRDVKQSHIYELCVLVVCSEIRYSLFPCSILGTRRFGMLLTLPS